MYGGGGVSLKKSVDLHVLIPARCSLLRSTLWRQTHETVTVKKRKKGQVRSRFALTYLVFLWAAQIDSFEKDPQGRQSIWSAGFFLESYFDFFFSGETANSVQFASKNPKLKRKKQKNVVLGKKAAQRQSVISLEHGPLKSTGRKLIPYVRRPKVFFECNCRWPDAKW